MGRGVWECEWWNVSCPARPSAVGSQIILDPKWPAVSSWTGAMQSFFVVCVCVCKYIYLCVCVCACVHVSLHACGHFQCHPRSKTWLMTLHGEEPLSQSQVQSSYKAGLCVCVLERVRESERAIKVIVTYWCGYIQEYLFMLIHMSTSIYINKYIFFLSQSSK